VLKQLISRGTLIITLALLAVGLVSAGEEESPVNPALVEGNTAFAFDLYQQIEDQEGNLFYSPFSISAALAMTYAGARGQTEAEMASALRFNLPQADLHPAFGALIADLTAEIEPASEDETPFTLNIANALWGQQGFPFREDYRALLDASYDAGLELVDFTADPDGVRETINAWVEDQTEDRIQDLIPEGVINPLTRLVLANAIYFNAGWVYTFEDYATQDAPFTLLDGSTVTVPTMRIQEDFRYAEGDGFQAVELPFEGRDASMLVILPADGEFEAFEDALGPETFGGIVGDLDFITVNLAFPRFEYEYTLNLTDTLQSMGMVQAFTESADLTGMFDPDATAENLFISAVLHKAFVSVDESGTEAAAATAVIAEAASAPLIEEIVEMRVDRPFLFVIRDHVTGAVLFVGRVVNPAE
jgi:serpin B